LPIISVPQAFNEDDLYVDLRSILGHPLFLKCEGFNFAGSIKLKAAAEMVDAAERGGVLTPESVLAESSSGNLGVALSMLAASKGYRFLSGRGPDAASHASTDHVRHPGQRRRPDDRHRAGAWPRCWPR
jgi:cysteine synthase